MKDRWQWLMIPLAMAMWIAYDKFGREPTDPSSPVAVVDPHAVELGQKYRTAFDAAGVAALDAVAGSPASTASDLARTQRDALDNQLKAAWSPLAAELTSRFGAVEAGGNPDQVRSFYQGLAKGWRKGAK